jgi:LPS-assembly protein
VTVNISLNTIFQLRQKMICRRFLCASLIITVVTAISLYPVVRSYAREVIVEPVQACVVARNLELTDAVRAKIAQCLGWQPDSSYPPCCGYYQQLPITPLSGNQVRIRANEVSFSREGRSQLSGNVEVQQTGRIVNAQTAYVYRDTKTNKVTQIELLGEVRYLEADRLMIARKAIINPQDKSGRIEDVLYRFNLQKRGAILPAWGRASLVERFANKDYLMCRATYTTCAPQDRAWQLEADSIAIDNAHDIGVARNAVLRIGGWPVLYTPFLSFPTSKKRKSGFLMPLVGHSNIGGFDLALPYYWNIAPNADATIMPHLYTRRGLMLEGGYRYLTENSFGIIRGRFLPHDRAYSRFLHDNEILYPELRGKSTNRWFFQAEDSTLLNPNLHFCFNFQQVSDDYFLQDFSSNLALLTERQLLRQGDVTYTTDHWWFRGMVQSYQTLHPINETPIEDIYQRLPQLQAFGAYDELPFNGNFSLLGQFDYFKWPGRHALFVSKEPYWPEDPFFKPFEPQLPENILFKFNGPRYHLNPILSFPQMKPWGYFTPSLELVENYYDVHRPFLQENSQFNRTIPRYSLDSSLYFERPTTFMNEHFVQTLEPRLYYLYVPFHNQSQIPVFDSAYMIFNTDQLFRTNRFSGFDRIGDTNHLAYALKSRWLSAETGEEIGSFTLGQIRYFANRRVQLCQSITGFCEDNPLFLGFLSPLAKYSPLATRGEYHLNPTWTMSGDYVWDPFTHATNNGRVNLYYQPGINKIISFGYTYLVNGDITRVESSHHLDDLYHLDHLHHLQELQVSPLHQATFSYAWPFSAKWSTFGAYNYNLSKHYEMMSFLGVQYDNCCWALRLIGGRTFQSLDFRLQPRYNNNVYLQILLKGLGSVGNSDPASKIHTFLPGYYDSFRR